MLSFRTLSWASIHFISFIFLLECPASDEPSRSHCTNPASVAILATGIRLFVKRSVCWFDDLCALLSMLCVISLMGILLTIKSSIASYYTLIAALFYSTIWLARLSILLTIIRINPDHWHRKLPHFAIVILFIVLPIVLMGQVFWVCEPRQAMLLALCQSSKQIALSKLVSDVIADLSLLGTSIHLFLVIQDRALRFRLSCLFSTCVFTTAVSFVNSSFIINSGGMKIVLIATVEFNVSLTVANIPALSSLFISGQHTSQRASGGVTSSTIPHFVRHVDSTQTSETPLPHTTDTIIKISPVVTIQEQHHNPESNPDDGKPTYEV